MQLPARYKHCFAIIVAAVIVTAAPICLAAETPASGSAAPSAPAILDDDPSALLGLTLAESFARFGPPTSVYALRGDESWQDDVAFAYGSGYTLFMFGDRLWQIRLTKPYAGSIFGLFLGDTADKVLSILGQPYENGPGFLVYRMPYKSYPIKLRLALKDERIADAYLFRADF